jgi:hypothetical protein
MLHADVGTGPHLIGAMPATSLLPLHSVFPFPSLCTIPPFPLSYSPSAGLQVDVPSVCQESKDSISVCGGTRMFRH